MAKFELKLPKMGESVSEATLTHWLKEVGDTIELDEPVVEIATDKVDSEVPSEVEGVLLEKLFNEDDVVQVGQTIAIIETEGDDAPQETPATTAEVEETTSITPQTGEDVTAAQQMVDQAVETVSVESNGDRFYSPLVKNIAQTEGISQDELDAIQGSGLEGRVTKDDILAYLDTRKNGKPVAQVEKPVEKTTQQTQVGEATSGTSLNGESEIMEMTRMGKLISKHMINSVQTSAHVQSFIEADVTNIWNWRNKVKDSFAKKEGEKITFTPIFMEAVAKAIRDFPLINISVEGNKIIKHKNVNLGMAAALPDGNLIVPVIKNADQLNLVGMTKAVNDLAGRARMGKLRPGETDGGTYTVTNVGTFGSVMGTPIINQPQVAILALGAIRKLPAVIETPQGDFIGIR